MVAAKRDNSSAVEDADAADPLVLHVRGPSFVEVDWRRKLASPRLRHVPVKLARIWEAPGTLIL